MFCLLCLCSFLLIFNPIYNFSQTKTYYSSKISSGNITTDGTLDSGVDRLCTSTIHLKQLQCGFIKTVSISQRNMTQAWSIVLSRPPKKLRLPFTLSNISLNSGRPSFPVRCGLTELSQCWQTQTKLIIPDHVPESHKLYFMTIWQTAVMFKCQYISFNMFWDKMDAFRRKDCSYS